MGGIFSFIVTNNQIRKIKMAKNMKPLTLEDNRLDKVRDDYGWCFKINGTIKVFSWFNRPRHHEPIGISPLKYATGKTLSEKIAYLNNKLARGEEIVIVYGTKKKQSPPVIKEIAPVKIEPRWELVPDWDAPKRETPTLSVNEVENILNTDINDIELTFKDWQQKYPHVYCLHQGDKIYVYVATAGGRTVNETELHGLKDYKIVDRISGPVIVLGKRDVPQDKSFEQIVNEEK
jgi:hypothetical protein